MSHSSHPQNRKEFAILILILGSITAIGPLGIDMYLPAFSEITKNFKTHESDVQLSLSAYFIGLSLSQLLYGPIIDRFGKKPPLFFGLLIFIATSIGCCFTNNIHELIILRFFQALGACACMVIPRAIVRDIFSPQESARVFSHLMLVMGLAPILAPLFGTFMLVFFGWKAIFVFLAAFGILCLAVSQLFLPHTKSANPEEKISHALKKYWEILQDRNFIICSISGGLTMAGLFAYITSAPFAYLDFFGFSSRDFSVIFAINSIGFITVAQINAYFLKRVSIENAMAKIIYVPAIAGLALIFIGTNNPTVLPFTITVFIFLASIGAISPTTTAIALSKQSKHSGSASALLGAIQFGFATITSILISGLHDGGLGSMSLVIGICGILACVVYKFFKN